jgi:hypothetical protein
MKGALRYAIIVAIVLALILTAGLVLGGIFGQYLNILYIALMVVAFFAVVSTALLIYAVIKLIQIIMLVREEVRPLLMSMHETVGVAKETAEAVKETAQYAGKAAGTLAGTTRLTKEYAVSPPIQAAAVVLASRQMVKVFFGKGHVRTRAEERRRRQTEILQREQAETVGGGE